DVEAGLVAPQADSRPVLRSNARPAGATTVRTVVRHRSQLPGPTVTVAALVAVSEALAAHVRALGEDPSLLGAEVTMAKAGARQAYNHFGNVGVGLYPELTAGDRAVRIAEDLARPRARAPPRPLLAANRGSRAAPLPAA